MISPKSIGLSLLCTALLLLSMTTFAAISLIEARDDLNRSQRMADRATAYQTAVNAAEEKLHDLQLEAQSGAPLQESVAWQQKVTDDQVLSVHLTFDKVDRSYRIVEWRIVRTGQWNPNATISGLYQQPS